jgi:hypothetical protein
MISNASGRGSTPPLQVVVGQDVAASTVEAYLSSLGFEARIALEATGIMAEKYSAGDILHYLDDCLAKNSAWSFIDLGHPYAYTANSQLTL